MRETALPEPIPSAAPARRGGRCLFLFLGALAGLLMPLGPATARPQLCEAAAATAAARTGVPLDVLRAISLTETGRRHANGFESWPWTVNMEGKGVWLEDREAALRYVRQQIAHGARSFDLGCFQINYRWHGKAFASLEEMIDPLANALYAASFLKTLHAETGDWTGAAGAYHSRTPKHADRYKEVFRRHRAQVAGAPRVDEVPRAPAHDVARANPYPLLVAAGTSGAFGSLVPRDARGGARALLAATPERQD